MSTYGQITITTNVNVKCYKNWNLKCFFKIKLFISVSFHLFICQNCVLSHTLFNFYSQAIFDEVVHDAEGGLRMNAELIKKVRYADDTDIILVALKICKVSHKKWDEPKVNVSKTKWMFFNKNIYSKPYIRSKIDKIEHVEKYMYLGMIVHNQWDMTMEIRSRIEKEGQILLKWNEYLPAEMWVYRRILRISWTDTS